jgi:NitT/TauT family transport system permease protein
VRSSIPAYVRPERRALLKLSAAAWSVALALMALLLVDVYARSELVTRLELVPVSEFLRGAVELVQDRSFLHDHLLPTVTSIVVTFLSASLLGVALAYLMTHWPWVADALQPYLDVFYAIPIFALYPVVVVLLGGGLLPIIILATLFSSVVIVSSSLVGFRAVPPIALKLARSLELSRSQTFRLLLLPAALPEILAGLKLGMSYAIIAILAGEFILSPQGLGHVVAQSYQRFDTTGLYAGITLVAAFSLAANTLLSAGLSRFDWRRR